MPVVIVTLTTHPHGPRPCLQLTSHSIALTKANKFKALVGRVTSPSWSVSKDGSNFLFNLASVSRAHGVISSDPNGTEMILYRDTNSKNGSSLNGRALQPNINYAIQHGDILTLAGSKGSAELRLDVGIATKADDEEHENVHDHAVLGISADGARELEDMTTVVTTPGATIDSGSDASHDQSFDSSIQSRSILQSESDYSLLSDSDEGEEGEEGKEGNEGNKDDTEVFDHTEKVSNVEVVQSLIDLDDSEPISAAARPSKRKFEEYQLENKLEEESGDKADSEPNAQSDPIAVRPSKSRRLVGTALTLLTGAVLGSVGTIAALLAVSVAEE